MSSIEKAMAKLQPKGAPQEPGSYDSESSKKLIQEAPEHSNEPTEGGEEFASSAKKSDDSTANSNIETLADGVYSESNTATELTIDETLLNKASPQESESDVLSSTGNSETQDLPTDQQAITSQAKEPLQPREAQIRQAAHTQSIEDEPAVPAKTEAETAIRKSNYFEIDHSILAENGIVTLESDNRILREQFRAIKRKILRNAFGNISETLHHPNLVIISSCNPHEGKTFSAINLAMNIALEKDKTVLLVDADIVRPSVANRIGMSSGPGLTEFLSGQVKDISDVLYSTNIDNFKFIPAGTPHELSTELLASSRMTTLIDELANRYPDRIVLFDAPPLLGVNETHILANVVGQALIVVVENQTKIVDIQAATDQLNKEIAVGFVINKSKRHWNNQYGYGYGGYGYGHYQKD